MSSKHTQDQNNNHFDTIQDDKNFGLEEYMKQQEKFQNQEQQQKKHNTQIGNKQIDEGESVNKFSQLYPAQQKFVKSGSLQFDIKLGWIPRAQIAGPIPIAFAHPDVDDLLLENIPKQSIVYLGYRPTNSFDIHRKFYNGGHNYPFNQFHLCKSQFLQRFFKKYYSDYQFTSLRKQGMKVQKSSLTFDSFFQGGNLDAVYLHQNQYRIFTRPDTNTKGHCSYYFFKYTHIYAVRVKCNIPGKYVFRIVNMCKPKSLYQRGLKPYVRTKQNPIWTQNGQNIKYSLSKLSEQFELTKNMYSLKFEYQFHYQGEAAQFCYGIPFTYTDLIKNLNELRVFKYFYLNKLCYTLSGVQVPLVTIAQGDNSNDNAQNSKKYVIVISGRCHPSQTHSSHIINGFLKSLLSNKTEAIMLRKNIIFKIVPMINPDGVIVGNTRTSIAGKDLNRVYSEKTDFVFPQIIGIRDFTKKLKQKYGNKLLFFIDMHGHSTRKNSFFFGPQYPVFDQQYSKCRLLPKIFANITDIFRYYSCKFRLSSFKQKTCRGYLNSNNIVRTYTYQTSMYSYFNFSQRKDQPFTQDSLQKLGEHMMLAIYGYVNSFIRPEKTKIPEPIDVKKRQIKQKSENKLNVQQNSDDMQSDKADSQDSVDDYASNQLQIFFNRINQNKQYFYEQLMAFNNLPFQKTTEKRKRKLSEAQQKIVQKISINEQISNTFNNSKRHNKTKSEWAPKLDFSPRKKQFIQYPKLSNMVFGSTYTNNFDQKLNLLYNAKPNRQNFNSSRYTFVSPIFNGSVSYQSQSSTNRFPEYKLQPKSRFFNQQNQIKLKVSQKKYKNQDNLQKSLTKVQDSTKKNINQNKRFHLDINSLKETILEPKKLSILGQIESYKIIKHESKEPKANKNKYKEQTIKVLNRKKSIKSFKQQSKGKNQKLRQIRSISQKAFKTRLPSIQKIISNY